MERFIKKILTIEHSYTDEERAEWRRIVAARTQLDKDETALKLSTRRDNDAKLAAKLAGYTRPPEVELDYNMALLRFELTEKVIEDEPPKAPAPKSPPSRAQIYVDTKTLNALLHGKLLTDAEKRKLMALLLPEGVLTDEVPK